MEEGKGASDEMRLWRLWDSVVHYTSLGRRKLIDGNSFDVHGTTVMENFPVVTNSFLDKGEGEIRYQH